MIMIYYWDKKLKKDYMSWYNNNLKKHWIDVSSSIDAFLQDIFLMTAIALVSVINPYHINGVASIVRHPVLVTWNNILRLGDVKISG